MDLLSNIVLGLGVAMTPENLLYGLFGCFLGTAIGVLPGIGPIATISLLLPLTFVLPPLGGLIMLAGIYYGSQYGGSTTAILVNMPGETSAVVTCIDGYEMARQGRAGPALVIAALGSFFAGTVATVIIAVAAVPLADVALEFGPPEYAALMFLGLIASVVLANGVFLKALGMIFLGLLLGTIGTDVNSGAARYTFGFFELSEGLNFVPLAVGVFGITEILSNLERRHEDGVSTQKLSRLWLSREDIRRAAPAVARGTLMGSLLGLIPGGGIILSTFASYTLEKKISKQPESFGRGAIEGVAAPESANNAASQISFIPMLTLGIPPTASLAMMMWAMTVHGIRPGPQVMNSNPELFWGLIASMWIGNIMLVILNLPMIGLWVKLLHVPYRLLFPAILLFCAIGVYSVNTASFDIYLAVLLGLFGYMLRKSGCEPAPFLLGFIIGPLLEENLRRAMLISRGDPIIFMTRPVSAALICISAALLFMLVLPAFRRKRQEAFREA
ncbi:tripartite tricarboxylate transporter permease [Undibacter mobilis]|uniref:Tripartite tricarboxylate transporter permease n=1 Tax=Undibacter mobilis TaxID=2292256 RepID=A0A371BC60_9BRAD|nr:tripartite tricarboxylate transporter permease [Undibacter mobilis]RDV05003.1 tripartite tricarboxylate transporter permease [Undibacter mobilis]